ncbi:DeoR/GlpR family DNA-binding transcription regulator [Dellaglioa sp. L3N]
MLTIERYQFIRSEIDKHGYVKLQDICHRLNVSESTVRRDLQQLETDGELLRVHGGAQSNRLLKVEANLEDKSTLNISNKTEIAKTAVKLIQPNNVIFLDAGSTTFAMIPYLNQIDDLTVVTNGVNHALSLAEYNVKTIVIGGQVKANTKAIVGSGSIETVKNLQFNLVFLGMNSINLDFGFSTPDSEEAAVKVAAMNQGRQTYVLADSSKFNQVSFVKVADLNHAIIITDKLPINDIDDYKKQTTIQEAL